MSGLVFALGSVIVVITAANVVFTLVLPRRPAGIERLSLVVNRLVRIVFLAVSRSATELRGQRRPAGAGRPRGALGAAGGVAGVLRHRLRVHARAHDPLVLRCLHPSRGGPVQRRHVARRGTAQPLVDIAAGATWAVVVTLQIAYLPSLYDAFNRRETLVAMLESRAGPPGVGPRGAGPSPAGRHRRRPPRLLFRLGAMGRGPGREPHHLSGPPAVPVARAVVLVGRGPAGRARRRRHAPGPVSRRRLLPSPPVPAHGVHRPQPDRQDPRMARGPGSQSRRGRSP